MPSANAEQEILAQERRALDGWSSGDPMGYAEVMADDVTYIDDIGAQNRIEGIEAQRAYLASLRGEIPAHRYELQNTKVQIYGDTAVLTMRYAPSGEDGTPFPPWKATSVYHHDGQEWRIVHAHWSMMKEA